MYILLSLQQTDFTLPGAETILNTGLNGMQ